MKYLFLVFASFLSLSLFSNEPYEIEKLYSQNCEIFTDQFGKFYLDFSSIYTQIPCYYEIDWKGHSSNCPCEREIRKRISTNGF